MNLEEVAKRVGVSTATVSRVLNNIDVVKMSTRNRVMRAVAELNYHPNLNARALAGGKSRTLGMIVSNLENPFFLDVFRSLETEAHSQGYEVFVANTGYSAEQMVKHVRLMIGRRVDGLAVIVSELDPELMQELSHSKIPTVFFDPGAKPKHAISIRVNYRRSIERIVEYLHALGHNRLAFIGHHSSLAPISEREKAFVETVSRYGHQTQYRTIADQDGFDGGRNAARKLLASGFQPTAVICVNDFMAVGVLRELREQGLKVPVDISVTGFDNIKLSEYCYPPLTTVHIPRDQIGLMVFQCLVTESEPKSPGRELVLDPELVLRESTGSAPGGTGRKRA